MKTNEAPEKIYVNFPFGERHPERGPMVTKQGLNAEDIEYTRTDAFIEKAEKWIKNNGYMYNGECEGDVKAMAEHFVNCMKGE